MCKAVTSKASYILNYRKYNGKWYFSDALREGVRSNGGVYANEVKITEILPEKGNQIPYLERLERGRRFSRCRTFRAPS